MEIDVLRTEMFVEKGGTFSRDHLQKLAEGRVVVAAQPKSLRDRVPDLGVTIRRGDLIEIGREHADIGIANDGEELCLQEFFGAAKYNCLERSAEGRPKI